LEKDAALDFQPEPSTQVIRGPYGRPSIGDKQLSSSAKAAYRHALLWYITEDQAHADKAIEIINAWSPVLWGFDDNDAKVLAGWTGYQFCNAAEILRCTDSGWEEKDIEQFERMLLTAYYPMIQNFFPEANGNWDAALINTMMCIGVFLDNREIFDRDVNHYLLGPGNGGITKYLYPNGQCQESTRDMGHTQMGLDYFAKACQVAWNQGVDLYGTADNRLALGFEYMAKYMLEEDVPVYGTISSKGRGEFRDNYELAYQHYRYIKGIDLPYTARAIEQTRPESSIEVLTCFQGELEGKRFDLAPGPLADGFETLAGALADPSGEMPPDAIRVEPGESIQAALDAAAENGGTVWLAKGVHTLPETLKVPSDITIAGEGAETILFLDPALTEDRAGTAMVNATPDMNSIELRDFVIEGALTVETSKDPNQDRRQRSYQMSPSRAGIIFSGEQDVQMSNIRIEHVTVRNNTHQGVAIKGAQQVEIASCDFSDNGSSVVPGPGLLHNVFITRVEQCNISNSRFDTSPWGSGIVATHSDDIIISDSELARNALHGIRMVDCRNISIDANLLEGNDGNGLLIDHIVDGSAVVTVRDNIARYNGNYGIVLDHVKEGTLAKNALVGNGQGDDIQVNETLRK
jgi:parallel beta-helix repeat protein